MSRAYRIKVSETLRRVIRAEDHVRSQLELLDILPCDEMADLLANELAQHGFQRDGDTMSRQEDDISVEIDLPSGTVTVRAESAESVELKGERKGYTYEEYGRSRAEQELRDQLAADLEKDAQQQESQLQKEVTDKLEAELADLQGELNQAVNRATAEALKQKAARIGQIKEMTDDPQTGSLTIVLEV